MSLATRIGERVVAFGGSRVGRWSVRIGLALVAARALLALAQPLVMELVAARLGLECQYDSLDLSLLRGEAELRGLRLYDEQGTNWLHLERARANVALGRTLAGDPTVTGIEVEGLALFVRVRPDGTVEWLERLGGEPQEAQKNAAGAPELDFTLPVRLESFALTRGALRVQDESVSPTFAATLQFDASAARLGEPEGEFALWATSPELVDTLRVEGRLSSGERHVALELDWRVEGLKPQPAARELARVGLAPASERVDTHGGLRLGLEPSASDATACEGGLVLERLALEVDGVERLRLDSLALALRRLSPTEIAIASLRASGGKLEFQRDSAGRFGTAGLVWSGAPTAAAPAASAAEVAGPSPSFALDELACEDTRVVFADFALEAAEPLEFLLRRAALRSLAWPPKEQAPAPFEATFELPDVCALGTLDGDLRANEAELALHGALALEGLTLARLRPQLEALGLEPTLRDGTLQGSADVSVRRADDGVQLSGALSGVRLVDGEALGQLEQLALVDLHLAATAARIELGSLDVRGPKLRILREKEGQWAALGLRQLARAAAARPAVEPEVPAPNATRFELPSLRVGRLALTEAELEIEDRSVVPVVQLERLALSASLEALDTRSPTPARIAASFTAAGLVEESSLSGTLALSEEADSLALRLALRAQGLALAPLAPYLNASGLEPELANGSATADLAVTLAPDSAGVTKLELALERVALRDGERELAGLEALRVKALELAGPTVRWERVEFVAPSVALSRDSAGFLHAAGLRTMAPRETAEIPAETGSGPPELRLALPALATGPLRLQEARVTWRDESLEPAVELALRADASLEALAVDGVPRKLGLRVLVPGVVDAAVAEGTLSLGANPSAISLALKLVADRLQPGPLAAYLPPNVTCELVDARAAAKAFVRVEQHPAGGLALAASLAEAELATGERSLVRLSRAGVSANRIDPQARVFEFGELVGAVANVALERDADGTLHALGLRIAPRGEVASTTDTGPAPARTLPSWVGPIPTVSLGEFALSVARLELRDAALAGTALGAQAAAIVASASLRSPSAQVLLAPSAESLPPLAFDARLSVPGALELAECNVRLAPWAAEPEFELDFEATGLDGSALEKFAPALAQHVDGRELRQGRFRTGLRARLGLSRRGPLGIDWASGVRGELTLEPTIFRENPTREPGLALAGVRAELERFDARTGDTKFKLIEVSTPRLRASRDAEGLHALGLTLKLPAGLRPAESPEEARETAGSAAASPAAALARAPELAIERLVVLGLDVELVDTTGPEPVRVPLTDLEFELRKLSTHALAAGGSVQFSGVVESGKVALPPRIESDSVLSGIASAAVSALAGDDEPEGAREERPLSGSISIAGRVAPFPAPTGWITFDASELELTAFRGLAAAQGVEVGDGLLDLAARVRLAGEDGLSLDASASFAHLSLSEPADGPISRYLALPAPLDAVLFLLEDAEGRQRVPVSVSIGRDGLSLASVASAAATAAATVIARAVASSPLRLAGTFTDMLGLTGGEEPPPSADARRFPFEPGDVTAPLDPAQLEPLRRRLAANDSLVVTLVHEFGPADLERAQRLANPDAADCRLLSARLRQRRSELARLREEHASESRLAYALGRSEEAERVRERVRGLDRELGLVEGALDRLHELLRPGAERRTPERSRAAALAIASERLERVRQALISRGIEASRIEVRRIRRVTATAEAGGVTAIPRKKN